MVTFIEIIDGNNEGSRFKIEEGLTLGRSKAHIVVKDPKVSSTHAKIILDGKGQFVLVDQGSSNGIHINGRRVKKVALLPGVIFELGRTQFKVVQIEEEQAVDFSRLVTWRIIAKESISGMDMQNRTIEGSPQSFTPALRLTFTQGIQADQEIVLGYGPRNAGAQSLDIELLDEDAPKEAFEIRPGPGQAEIKIKAPGRVTLNNTSKTADVLQDGDFISFGTTIIKVSYL
ncbi:FHA domain protein [compost metagenome]